MYKISILDQSPVINGESNAAALQRTVTLAKLAEELGYARFWVSEHHNSEEVAGSSPEVLISFILANTKTIRVGSGGVMLSHYSPYKVAENFNVLANLAPGRVDLGVGKAPGGLPVATKALQYNGLVNQNDFNERLALLKQYVETSGGELIPSPLAEERPEVIVLGGSIDSAKTAAELGFTYVFAQFINGSEDVLLAAAKVYKEIAPQGTFGVGIAAIAADEEQEAKRLAEGNVLYKVHLQSGRTLSLTNFEAADQYGRQSGEAYEVVRTLVPMVSGTAQQVQAVFDRYHAQGVDEFIIHNPITDEAARIKSIELLSPIRQYEKVGN